MKKQSLQTTNFPGLGPEARSHNEQISFERGGYFGEFASALGDVFKCFPAFRTTAVECQYSPLRNPKK